MHFIDKIDYCYVVVNLEIGSKCWFLTNIVHVNALLHDITQDSVVSSMMI